MPLALKDNKTYLDGEGNQVVVRYVGGNPKFPFEDAEGRQYTHGGAFKVYDSVENLIEEV